MNLRRDPIYLSSDVWRACLLIARSSSTEGHMATADEIADGLLRNVIKDKWPQLFQHQQQVAKLETELLKTLQ